MALLKTPSAAIGSFAPDFSLPATDGNTYSLDSFADKDVLVVIFMCNHCPYVKAVLERLNTLHERFVARNVQIIGISANDAENYPEDSFEAMQQAPVDFLYLYDESQEVAKAYGAVCTPDIFVYDKERKLSYRGRIDDNWKEPENVTREELAEAIEKTLQGESIPREDQKSSMGCSIKWK